MLHWPDSMVSYLEEDKVLFSNDAFGQNIASSFRFADETDHKTILNATKGYYYNIVLPYSPQVLKTLKRVTDMGLQFDVIAPDHGLIFRTPEDVAFIINTYKELAEQKPVCAAVIAYDSMWGGTAKLAEAVADGLADEDVPFVMYNLQNTHPSEVTTALADAGALILGSPTRNNMPMVNMVGCIAHIKGLRPQNLVGAAFGCYGWSGEAPKMLTEALTEMKVEVVAEPVKSYFNPQEEDLAAARALGGKSRLDLGAPCLHGLAERGTLLPGHILHSLDKRRNGTIATNVFDAQLFDRRGIGGGGDLGQRRGLALFKFFECHGCLS
jgi:flavorubredoxin